MSNTRTIKEWKELLAGPDATQYVEEATADTRKGVQQLVAAYWRREKKHWEEIQRLNQMYTHESAYYKEGLFHVAGVDEVGRGPVVGPVVVAAVILPPNYLLPNLKDSKALSEAMREELYARIVEDAVAYHIVSADHDQIDRYNIYAATQQAMYEAVKGLAITPDAVLVDAMPLEALTMPTESIIHGDAVSASIAAASILAKVTRDHYMETLDAEYPMYGFAKHKGYLTKEHIQAIASYGPCPYHRKSFEPIKSLVGFDRDYWYLDESDFQ